jgi:hypothetical protein
MIHEEHEGTPRVQFFFAIFVNFVDSFFAEKAKISCYRMNRVSLRLELTHGRQWFVVEVEQGLVFPGIA